jgi:hypothetical protein
MSAMADNPVENPHPDHLPELIDSTSAGPQAVGLSAERLVPVPLEQVRDALRPAEPEDLNEAMVSLIRQESLRTMFLAYLRDNSERYREAMRRVDELQERLHRDQRDSLEELARHRLDALQRLTDEQLRHAETRRDLINVLARNAGQILLQILGSCFLGWGLSEIGKTWAAAAYIPIGLVMITFGALPLIRIPWRRGGG